MSHQHFISASRFMDLVGVSPSTFRKWRLAGLITRLQQDRKWLVLLDRAIPAYRALLSRIHTSKEVC